MTALGLTDGDDAALLRESARGWLADRAPVAAFRALRDAGRTRDPALWRAMAEMGWAGVLVPEALGGAGMGHAAAGVLAAEMGRVLAVSPFLSTAVMAATLLRAAGRTERLPALAAGEATWAFALDEGPKHAPEAVTLRAERRGNAWRLDGAKTFVVDGGFADRLVVLARAEEGPTLFEIAADAPGVARARRETVDGRDAAGLTFDGVEATGEALIGAPGAGLAALAPALEAGRAALAAEMTGLAVAAAETTVAYLKERRQFDRPIGSFQALQHRTAALWCEIEVTDAAVGEAARMLDVDAANAALAVSVAKARAAETAALAAAEGVQMHGGIGMTDAHDIGFFMKRARVAAEWLGDYGFHAGRVLALRLGG